MQEVITANSTLALWQSLIRQAEIRCEIILDEQLESYLTSLLIRHTDNPQLAKQLFAKSFLEALNLQENQRIMSLQLVGDQCLLYAGLFPHAAKKKNVKINYFVQLGRSAYANISQAANDFYSTLAYQFVSMMDVLQSIRETPDLLPLDAYEQWDLVGSKRALQILKKYTHAVPQKKAIC